LGLLRFGKQRGAIVKRRTLLLRGDGALCRESLSEQGLSLVSRAWKSRNAGSRTTPVPQDCRQDAKISPRLGNGSAVPDRVILVQARNDGRRCSGTSGMTFNAATLANRGRP
jgi:hypothetical protein